MVTRGELKHQGRTGEQDYTDETRGSKVRHNTQKTGKTKQEVAKCTEDLTKEGGIMREN